MTSMDTIEELRAKLFSSCTPEKLLRLLRHNLELSSMADEYGFVALYDLNNTLRDSGRKEMTQEMVMSIADNINFRGLFEYKWARWNYTYDESKANAKKLIGPKTKAEKVFMVRATEGHSFTVKEKPIEPFVLPKEVEFTYLYHLTNHRLVSDILRRGLGPEANSYVVLHEHRHKVKVTGPLNTLLEIGPIDSYVLQVELPMKRAVSGHIITKKLIPSSLIRVVVPHK